MTQTYAYVAGVLTCLCLLVLLWLLLRVIYITTFIATPSGGSHCVKVRVLTRLSLWPRYLHGIFATCCRLFG